MRDIESKFQTLANAIIDGSAPAIGDVENRAINNFFALWYMRSRHRKLPVQEIVGKGITGGEWTKDQEEMFESSGIMFVRKGGALLARQINGAQLQIKVGRYVHDVLSSFKWGVIHAQSGEFVVPDVPNHDIIPIAPTICLAANAPHGTMLKSNVAEINRAFQSASQDYFFARDFSKCPI